jgi:hypothetical protein
MKRVMLTILVSIFGVLSGIFFGYWSSIGFSRSWKTLPETPQTVDSIYIATENIVYIQTVEQQTYSYDTKTNKWLESANDDLAAHLERMESCNYDSKAFAFLAFPPKKINQCYQVMNQIADGYTQSILVRDHTGRIWLWQMTRSPFMAIGEQICYPGLGLLAGLTMGLLLSITHKSTKQK